MAIVGDNAAAGLYTSHLVEAVYEDPPTYRKSVFPYCSEGIATVEMQAVHGSAGTTTVNQIRTALPRVEKRMQALTTQRSLGRKKM